MESSIKFLQVLGPTSSIFLSGIYFSSSQLTLPILYRLPTATSTSAFTEFYYRGAIIAVPMALVSSLSSATAAYFVALDRMALSVAAAATFATLPWTMLVMMSINKRLIELDGSEVEGEKAGTAKVIELLKQWKWMNMVGSALALVGGFAGVWAFVQ